MAGVSDSVQGYNLYAYCFNNPINLNDSDGNWPKWIKNAVKVVACVTLVSAVVTAAVVVAHVVANDVIDKAPINEVEKSLAKSDYVAAYQVNESRKITEEYIDKTYGQGKDIDGTQVNAYRHAMWNAVMTDKIGEEKAKAFADAHEQIPNNPIQYYEMDIHNNELGRKIAIEYAGQGYDVFSQKILEAISNGEAEVIIWDPKVK